MERKSDRSFDVSVEMDGVRIYKNGTFTFQPGATVLLGCNGAGKTTLMWEMKGVLENDGVPFYDYSISKAESELSKRAATGSKSLDIGVYLTSKFFSEGEQIKHNLLHMASEIGAFVRHELNENAGQIWLFFDSLDSGWSIDNIMEFKDFVNEILLSEDADIFVIVAANSYEFTTDPAWFRLDVQSSAYLPPFESYGEYKEYVLGTRAAKDEIWS